MTHLEFDCADDKAQFLLKAARLYDEGLRNLPEWIPCSEMLPETYTHVIATAVDGGEIETICAWDDGYSWNQNTADGTLGACVIAWMPLPPPYKKGE